MARGYSQSKSESIDGRSIWEARQGAKSIAALKETATRLGNGEVGNGVMVGGQLNLRSEDIKYLTESLIGPKNEISDMFDQGTVRMGTYRAYEKVEGLHFYPENLTSVKAYDGYIESNAFTLEPKYYASDSNSGSEYNEGSVFVEVNAKVLQADYKLGMGIDLDDDSAKRLAESFKKALGESIEQWAEDREERRRG